jgi:ABC-type spermidine/putrescine transport system permease subunit I
MPARIPERSARIRRAIARDHAAMFLLTLPALVLLALLLVVPMAWLVALSFIHNGALTIANYVHVFTDKSYADSFALTLTVSGVVTAITGLYGYLLAYAMTRMPRWAVGVCLTLVALPFWTSVLVRAYAWLALLQYHGIINNMLIDLHIIDTPLQMVHNLTGTYVGMVHFMLPFMIFPIYAGLRHIDPDFVKAARGLGATTTYAFWRVYFPLSLPGLAAGALIVFVFSLAFYVTPVLLGGGRIYLMSIIIERDVNFNRDWGPASAVSVLFVLVILAIFAIGNRVASLDRAFRR